MEEEFKGEVVEKKKKKDYKSIFKIIGIALIILTVLVFAGIKIVNPDFDWKWFLLGIGFIVIGVLLIKGFDWYNKVKRSKEKKTEDGVPDPATKEEINKALHEFVVNERENHVKRIKGHIPFNFGKNEIYIFNLELWYDDGDNGKEIKVMLNANYLNKKPFLVFPAETSYIRLKERANGYSSNKEESPEEEISRTEDPTTGKVHTYVKKTPSKKKKNKEKETEDLG